MKLTAARRFGVILVALALTAGTLAPGRPEDVGLSSERLQRINQVVQRYIDEGQITGAVTMVSRKGQVAHFEAQGQMDLEAKAPMRKDAIFRIASMSKPITGVAMMQLYEKGLWKPEDPVSKWFPELANLKVATSADNLDNLAPASHVPTMRELFTHTAGFGYGLNSATAVDRAFIERSPMFEKDMPNMIRRVSEIPLATWRIFPL